MNLLDLYSEDDLMLHLAYLERRLPELKDQAKINYVQYLQGYRQTEWRALKIYKVLNARIRMYETQIDLIRETLRLPLPGL